MNINCSCKLEAPCDEHVKAGLGDKVKDGDKITFSIDKSKTPHFLYLQFDLWHTGKIPEDDFLQSILYMAKEGMILVNGKQIKF